MSKHCNKTIVSSYQMATCRFAGTISSFASKDGSVLLLLADEITCPVLPFKNDKSRVNCLSAFSQLLPF
jgi:hypothetical protein